MGDQAKVRIHLPTGEIPNGPAEQEKVRKIAEELGLVLVSISVKELDRGSGSADDMELSPTTKVRSRHEVFDDYCARNGIVREAVAVGKTLLED